MKTIPSFPEYKMNRKGIIVNRRTGRTLSPSKNLSHKYNLIKIRKEGRYYTRRLSRLIYETFVGVPFGDIHHKDGNKKKDRLYNLEDLSSKRHQRGAFTRGKKGRMLYQKERWLVRKVLNEGYPQRYVAKMFKVSQRTILNISKKG